MSVEFLSPLTVQRLSDGRRILMEPLVVRVDGLKIECPAHMTTDYSSVPQAFDSIFPWEAIDLAGVVHDGGYQDPRGMSRLEWDIIWRKVAQAGNPCLPAWKAYAGYWALRAGGWVAWNAYRRGEDPGV